MKSKIKLKNRIIKSAISLSCFFAALSYTEPSVVYAADATVIFGSDSYEGESGNEFPVGVYIDGDDTIGYYRVEIEYDPTRLEYIDGGNSGGDGTVVFEGNGNDVRESTLLSFKALSGGSTELKIKSATVRVSGSGEDFNITETARVPVVLAGEDTVNTTATTEETVEATETTAETEATEAPAPSEGGSDVRETGSDGAFLPVLIVVLLLAGLAAVIAALAVRKKNIKKRRRKEYIKSYNKRRSATAKEIQDTKKQESVPEADTVRSATEETVPVAPERELQPSEEASYAAEETPVISVKNVSMRFYVSGTANSGLKDYAIQKLKGKQNKRVLDALKHISFDIYKGEVVGIIGTNGSGKSTLLKIVSGALQPTSGRVDADKSKIQLLTLGTGFDAELTAKENIYLNGAIIGYTKEFIDAHYDEIVEFAELEDFTEEKVKNFSSGMVSRLGFSIATVAGASDILILDEVFSVGDQFFRSKSMKRIKEMIHGGATVLIVSHSLAAISAHCDKVIWIEKGVLKMVGRPETVCAEYSRSHK